jgi:hypothetical protein
VTRRLSDYWDFVLPVERIVFDELRRRESEVLDPPVHASWIAERSGLPPDVVAWVLRGRSDMLDIDDVDGEVVVAGYPRARRFVAMPGEAELVERPPGLPRTIHWLGRDLGVETIQHADEGIGDWLARRDAERPRWREAIAAWIEIHADEVRPDSQLAGELRFHGFLPKRLRPPDWPEEIQPDSLHS